jgi:hypothetical protein
MVFFELSVPFEQLKQKGKQIAGITPQERLSLEARIDALVLRQYCFGVGVSTPAETLG